MNPDGCRSRPAPSPADRGWEVALQEYGSIAFADLDNDSSPEVISTNEAGSILVYHLDGTDITYFPITGDFSYASSPQILDFDGDGDLELFAGSTLGIEAFDVKTQGSNEGYWSTHRSNQYRTGYIELVSSSCTTADVNSDGVVNILDLVEITNLILADEYDEIADMNEDGTLNILDIVSLMNVILFE